MVAKIIRIALVAMAVLVMALSFPKLYKTTFEERDRNPDLVFSEVLNEFVRLNWEYDTATMRDKQVGRDKHGRVYAGKELQWLFPMKNYRQLVYDNEFPDTIRGQHVTTNMIEEAMRFPLFLSTGGQHRPLLWMFESVTDGIKMDLPEDLFRVDEQGIKFVKTSRNSVGGIDSEKSWLFTEAMKTEGFLFPDKNIYGITNTSKSKDDGYFFTDSKDEFYHVKMVNGQPVCHQILLPEGMKIDGMNCQVDDHYYGYVYDQNYNIYLLSNKDYSFFQLPIYDYKDFGTLILMEENLFFYTYRLYGLNKAKYYVMDKEHHLIAAEQVDFSAYEDSKVGLRENYFFPFKARFTRDGAKHLAIDWYKPEYFGYLNGGLMLVLLGIMLFQRRSFKNPFNYIDLAIVGICGIYGFLGVLIFPNRK